MEKVSVGRPAADRRYRPSLLTKGLICGGGPPVQRGCTLRWGVTGSSLPRAPAAPSLRNVDAFAGPSVLDVPAAKGERSRPPARPLGLPEGRHRVAAHPRCRRHVAMPSPHEPSLPGGRGDETSLEINPKRALACGPVSQMMFNGARVVFPCGTGTCGCPQWGGPRCRPLPRGLCSSAGRRH